jgi:hypothetical protein
MTNVTEVEVGPFIFQYDEKHKEMYVNRPEEHIGTVNSVWPEDWAKFLGALIGGQ